MTISRNRKELGTDMEDMIPAIDVSTLYYGDNLDVLRKHIKDETVDLCYIDPPFNSKRSYNQIYNRIGAEDRAEAQAFIDTWRWDTPADDGYTEILGNANGRFPSQTIELLKGLHAVLKTSNLLAYLVSMTLRLTEIRRVLKPTGSFYLHCDQTASHYLKLILDSIFVAQGGEFLNEIIWAYKTGGVSKRWFGRKHDVLFLYAKSDSYFFNHLKEKSYLAHKYGFSNVTIQHDDGGDYTMVGMRDVWDIPALRGNQPETLGYPTQKPEAILERVINASSRPGDVVLDVYCGCGTSIAVAQRLGREWIGIDITYQAIALIMQRLEGQIGKNKWPTIEKTIKINGIPRDMKSAVALSHKKDDRLRKEFEKWAVLTYTKNRGMIYEKKGADAGIDGIVYFLATPTENASMVIQVKSGHVGRGDIATLRGDMAREGAAMATLITLEAPTAPMLKEAKAAGQYLHEVMGRNYDCIQVVTVQEIIEENRRLDLPMSLEVVKKARGRADGEQLGLPSGKDSDE